MTYEESFARAKSFMESYAVSRNMLKMSGMRLDGSALKIASRADSYDAEIEAAFADHNFRGVELVRLDAPNRAVEGKSWHHTFSAKRVVKDGVKLWEVTVARTSHTEPLSKTALLTNDTLDIYAE